MKPNKSLSQVALIQIILFFNGENAVVYFDYKCTRFLVWVVKYLIYFE